MDLGKEREQLKRKIMDEEDETKRDIIKGRYSACIFYLTTIRYYDRPEIAFEALRTELEKDWEPDLMQRLIDETNGRTERKLMSEIEWMNKYRKKLLKEYAYE